MTFFNELFNLYFLPPPRSAGRTESPTLAKATAISCLLFYDQHSQHNLLLTTRHYHSIKSMIFTKLSLLPLKQQLIGNWSVKKY